MGRAKQGWERWVFIFPVLGSLLILGNFATASRAAVIVTAGVFFGAGCLIFLRGEARAISRYLGLGVSLVVALIVLQILFPAAFDGYIRRAGGALHSQDQNEQIVSRLAHNLTGWQNAHYRERVGFFGLGLGTMSNGVQNLSPYAAEIRSAGVWGEADMINTFLEGGYYLIFVWTLFRLAIIIYCVRLCWHLRRGILFYVGAAFLGYVGINGIISTLGIQPPLAVWFWMSVGFIMILTNYSQRLEASRGKSPRRKLPQAPPRVAGAGRRVTKAVHPLRS